jgi:predicted MFS family arabinose efflux permease
MTPSDPRRWDPLPALLGIGAATAAAHVGNNFTTYLIGGLMDRFGFSPLQMGAFSMAETLSYATAMFIISPRVARLSPRQLMLAAGAIVACAQLASVELTTFAPLLAGRIVTGLGFGLANTALNLAAGRSAHPARAVSAGITVQTVIYALVNIGLPIIGKRSGVAGMFAALAALTAVLTLAAGWLPSAPQTMDGAHDLGRALRAREPLGADGWRVLAAMALFTFGSLAIWPFMERAAHAIAIPADRFGRYQSVATLLSALGNLGLAASAARLPVRWPLTLALLVCAVSCAALTTVPAAPAFALALILFNMSWFLSYPLLLGIAYAVDASGRLAVLCSAAWLLMMSVGSLASGATARELGGYQVIGPIGMLVCLLAVAAIWPLATRLDGSRVAIRIGA